MILEEEEEVEVLETTPLSTPSEAVLYALIHDETIIQWDIPKAEKTEADEDDDMMFLTKTYTESPNLTCVP